MANSNGSDLGRLLTAMVTPMDEQGRIDWGQVKKLAKGLIECGNDGVVVCGTTGENPTLTNEEKLRMWAETKAAIGKSGKVVANTGNYSTQESTQLTKEAEEVGVDGLLLTVPYYNKPPQEGIYQHFKAIASSTHLPCMMYNIPGRTSVNMTVETTIRCGHIDNIVGVKEASGNMEQIARIIDGARDGFKVWSGNDGETYPIMALGGYGIVSVIGNLFARQMKRMVELTASGKMKEAQAEHLRLMPIGIGFCSVSTNPIPIKYAMNKAGFRVGKPRLPLVEPDAKAAAVIDKWLQEYRVDLVVG
jgi:4-hydroxy-tetrahydrodipicolinate synthase